MNGSIQTPNIDSIGVNGAAFTRAYAGHATCAPSRAALLTGRYPTKIGYEFTPITDWGAWMLGKYMNNGDLQGVYHSDKANGVHDVKVNLPLYAPTIAESLSNGNSSYKSIYLGKWHNGNDDEFKPLTRGFDESLAFSLISSYLPIGHPDSVECRLDDFLDKFIYANIRYQICKNRGDYFEPRGYLTDYLAEEAASAISANKGVPFFMYLSFTAVHTPLQALLSDYNHPSLSGIDNHCSRVYAAMLIALDRAIGKVLQALEENGLTEDTLIIFTSDNGAPSYINQPEVNKPYRGWKATFFEGGVRVPLMMRWPGVIPAGTSVRSMVSHVDIFPTVMKMAGISVEKDVDGVDLLPHALGSASKEVVHDTFFWRSGHYMSVRQGDWKLQVSSNPEKMWLYNLGEDEGEMLNLAYNANYSSTLEHMLAVLRAENAKQSEPLWPSLSETPILVDKFLTDRYQQGDEYIYWPN
eukprot:CAMPEP_0185029082 /NCGR_PEP_ID=MMETSP1103-20130426/15177_1 /TAXON_ID=36769 /ORGANISM="Paraphysomonas bandaiensis, Strain Caron Lab Isolate" /LENGTH=467 /DNA_ID=CAMNT_0027563699 /DNA_START=295 /DNA_END=1698 /DNA_ORIENTATION=+